MSKEETMGQEHLDIGSKDTPTVILEEIENACVRMEKWHKRAKRCQSLYRGDGDPDNPDSDKFKILWMITEIQRPMLYTGGARADVRRKNADKDDVARLASQLLERTTQCEMDDEQHEFDGAFDSAVTDYGVPGRGQVRVVYDAEFEREKRRLSADETMALEMDGEKVEMDDEGPFVYGEKVKTEESAWIEYVNWNDFLHSDGQKWEDVWWTAFGYWLTREDLVAQFGESGREVPLAGEIEEDDTKGSYRGYRRGRDEYARVWEFWSKRTGKVYKVAQNYGEFLQEPEDDPYELEGFFPCPKPIDMVCTPGSLEPIPEYKMYEDQATEANELTGRINRLIKAVKATGIYNQDLGPDVAKMFTAEDNTLMPSENFATVASNGGLRGAIMFAPIAEIADVIAKLVAQRQDNLNMIYEVIGLGDVMRGVTNPREAYKTQELKAQFSTGSTSRMRRKQRNVERLVRDAIRLLAEVISGLYDTETIVEKANLPITNPQLLEAAKQLLENDDAREYKIDVESDTTVAPDDEMRKQEFTEFIGAMGGLMGQLAPAMQGGMIPPELFGGIVMFGLRKFKAGRDVEEQIEQAFAKMLEAQKNKQPSPEEQQAQAKMQMEMSKLQLKEKELQLKAQEQLQDLQVKIMELQQDGKIEEAKIMQQQRSDMINLVTVMINSGQKGRPSES